MTLVRGAMEKLSTQLRGFDSHDAMWTPAVDDPVTQLVALGSEVCRCDFYLDWTFKNSPGGSTPAQNINSAVQWAQKMRAQSPPIAPFLVLTQENVPFFPLLDPVSCIAGLKSLTTAIPGLRMELGNEIEAGFQSADGIWDGPTLANAKLYATWYNKIAAVIKAFDPTCQMSPAPVSNINPGGWGDQFIQFLLEAGIDQDLIDIWYVHMYSWPSNVPPIPSNPFLDIATATKRWQSWGLRVPVGLSETGFWSWSQNSPSTGIGTFPEMTPALQAQYLTELLQTPGVQALPVVILYSLADNGGEQFGVTVWNNWPTGALVQKPSFAAVQALWNPAITPPPAENYQSLYHSALAQIGNRDNEMLIWAAANPETPGQAFVRKIVGEDSAWFKTHPAS